MKNMNLKYVHQLMLDKITNKEFINSLNIKKNNFEDEIYEYLEYSFEKHLSKNVEIGIYLIFQFDLYKSRFVDILNNLLISDWHISHEDIASLLQKFESPKSINYLFTTINSQYEYLNYDEAYALAVKCIWALGNINTPESREKLKLLLNSENEIIRNNAKYQLEMKR